MQYNVYLEVQDDGATMAHVAQLPGCTSSGATQEVALARLPEAIQAYNAWLRAHGEPAAEPDEPIGIEVGGTVRDSDPHLGDTSGLLPTDQQPVTPAEVAQFLRLMAYSRRDLLDQVTGMSRELLCWQPSDGSDGTDSWCIDDILEHVARAERVYASRLSGNVFEILEEARQAAVDRMARLTEQELSQTTEHQGEYWTARKVFRRFLEHEREHVQQIARVVSQFNNDQGLPAQ